MAFFGQKQRFLDPSHRSLSAAAALSVSRRYTIGRANVSPELSTCDQQGREGPSRAEADDGQAADKEGEEEKLWVRKTAGSLILPPFVEWTGIRLEFGVKLRITLGT